MQCMRIGAVALVVGVLASGCGSSASTGGERGPDVPPPAGLADGCPAWDAPVRYAEGDLREGAVSVRLCPGAPIVAYDGSIYDVGIQPPEVLTTRVDELVRAVNALESTTDEVACESDAGPRLTYWFTYPDGDARAVTFENFGCEDLIVGQHEMRAGGNRVAQLFSEALLAQRATAAPPAPPSAPPDCRGVMAEPGTALPQVPVDLAAASLCVEAGSYRVRAAAVPGELLTDLEDGLLAEPMPWDECVESDRRFAHLLGYTEWGDLVRYALDPCGRVGLAATPGWLRRDDPAYRLSPELAARLDALPLGPVVRYTKPFTRTTPPATPG